MFRRYQRNYFAGFRRHFGPATFDTVLAGPSQVTAPVDAGFFVRWYLDFDASHNGPGIGLNCRGPLGMDPALKNGSFDRSVPEFTG